MPGINHVSMKKKIVNLIKIRSNHIYGERVGEKRPSTDGHESESELSKKARGSGDGEVRLASNVKKVAEILLVLATMVEMRGGWKATSVEVEMMIEARRKLVGLGRMKETKLAACCPKMSIGEKLKVTKVKVRVTFWSMRPEPDVPFSHEGKTKSSFFFGFDVCGLPVAVSGLFHGHLKMFTSLPLGQLGDLEISLFDFHRLEGVASCAATVGTVVHVVAVVAMPAGSTWEELKHIRQKIGLLKKDIVALLAQVNSAHASSSLSGLMV
ncbi:hypothetical protein Tco_0765277 [Tanacetum coccineum]